METASTIDLPNGGNEVFNSFAFFKIDFIRFYCRFSRLNLTFTFSCLLSEAKQRKRNASKTENNSTLITVVFASFISDV